MGARGRRFRSVLDSQFWLVVAVLGLLLVGGGYLTYDTYADPGYQVQTQVDERAEYAGSFDHRATVQRPNPVFTVGETLVDRQAYFTRLAPRLNGTFSFTYTATERGQLATDVDLELRFRSVGEAGERGQAVEYWAVTRQLAAESAELDPGESVEVSFSRNVSELFNESQRIDERVGGTPGTKTVRIVAVVETEGEVNGREVSWTREYPLGVVDEDSLYEVSDPGRVVNTTATNQTVRVQNTFGPLRRGGAPLLVLVGLVGLGVLGVGRYRNAIALSDGERAYLTYERARTEFDDWITAARVAPETFDGERIDVESLDGLVDVAIDSDRRVLEDTSTGTCYCRVDGFVYRYEPPPEPPAGPLAGLDGRDEPVGPANRPDEWEDGDGDGAGSDRPVANGGVEDNGAETPDGDGQRDGDTNAATDASADDTVEE